MNQWFIKRFVSLILGEVIVVITIALFVVTKHLSGRAIGIVGLLNIALFATVFIFIFRKAKEKITAYNNVPRSAGVGAAQEQRLQLEDTIKRYKLGMLLVGLLWFFGLISGWLRGADWYMFLPVTAIYFGIASIFYRSIRRAQASLKQLGETT